MLNNQNDKIFNKQVELELLLIQLNRKIINYQIVSKDQQQVIATVKDFYLAKETSEEQVNLLIDVNDSDNEPALRLLKTRQIKSINLIRKIIVVNLTKEELEQLPLYHPVADNLSNNEQNLIRDSEPNEPKNYAIEQQQIATIPLLEERLTVNRNKRKIGEVSVRKKIATKIVQIPLRREILIIEQVGEGTKKLAEVDLEPEDSSQITSHSLSDRSCEYVIVGEYSSLEMARQILDQISLAAQNLTSEPKIKLEILVDNPVQQKLYQNLLKEN